MNVFLIIKLFKKILQVFYWFIFAVALSLVLYDYLLFDWSIKRLSKKREFQSDIFPLCQSKSWILAESLWEVTKFFCYIMINFFFVRGIKKFQKSTGTFRSVNFCQSGWESKFWTTKCRLADISEFGNFENL